MPVSVFTDNNELNSQNTSLQSATEDLCFVILLTKNLRYINKESINFFVNLASRVLLVILLDGSRRGGEARGENVPAVLGR